MSARCRTGRAAIGDRDPEAARTPGCRPVDGPAGDDRRPQREGGARVGRARHSDGAVHEVARASPRMSRARRTPPRRRRRARPGRDGRGRGVADRDDEAARDRQVVASGRWPCRSPTWCRGERRRQRRRAGRDERHAGDGGRHDGGGQRRAARGTRGPVASSVYVVGTTSIGAPKRGLPRCETITGNEMPPHVDRRARVEGRAGHGGDADGEGGSRRGRAGDGARPVDEIDGAHREGDGRADRPPAPSPSPGGVSRVQHRRRRVAHGDGDDGGAAVVEHVGGLAGERGVAERERRPGPGRRAAASRRRPGRARAGPRRSTRTLPAAMRAPGGVPVSRDRFHRPTVFEVPVTGPSRPGSGP